MICKLCSKSYERTSGVKAFRKDHGYCSIECIESSRPLCLNCGTKITRSPNEILSAFIRRRFCTQPCAASFYASQKRSDEVRKNMSNGRKAFNDTERGREVIIENSIRYAEWLESDIGKETRERQGKQFSEWLKTPDGVAWRKRADAARRTDEFSARASERLFKFYETERGQELKERYRQLYSGVPRPPEVTEKMLRSLDEFWSSADGDALAERLSNNMTGGFPETPYGPNWKRQRRKALKRDSYSCQLARLGNCEEYLVIQVHHIFTNRRFGYIPRENEHFRWANHLNNLICLCRRCHRLCETTRSLVPEPYLSNAIEHYAKFVLTITH